MKPKTLSYLAFLFLTPCALGQDSPQNDDKSPAKKAPDVADLQVVVPAEPAAADPAEIAALQAGQEIIGQETSALKTKDLEGEITQLENLLAEVNAASRQQRELLLRQIQKRVKAQKEALEAAMPQAQESDQRGPRGEMGGNYGGFGSSTGLVAASPHWLIGVQVQAKGNEGIKVISLTQDSPAGAAGLKKEDLILSANGLKIRNPEALRHLIQAAGDQQLEFLIKRDGDALIKLQVTPKKHKGTVDSYYPVPMGAQRHNGNDGLSQTIPPAQKPSDASLKRNLDQHPELKKLLNEYFEKHQKR